MLLQPFELYYCPSTNLWYFADETATKSIGGYPSQNIAIEAQGRYMALMAQGSPSKELGGRWS